MPAVWVSESENAYLYSANPFRIGILTAQEFSCGVATQDNDFPLPRCYVARMRTLTFRIFAIAILVSLASASRAQDFTCPVTKSVPMTFEPIGTWAHARAYLLGTEKLFTVFPGNWHTVQRTDRGLRVPKIVWGTNVVDLHAEVGHSSLTITGRRLDAESGPLVYWDANTAWIDPANPGVPTRALTPVAEVDKRQFFITSEFYVPALGCWEVTGHFHGEDLKVVIDLK